MHIYLMLIPFTHYYAFLCRFPSDVNDDTATRWYVRKVKKKVLKLFLCDILNK